ncbi:hypothetical protein HG530_011553 [Fusarium avenaceum]|nr:hypothetical protein HG530_011553 [Fusarium avenaceum]
MNTSSSCSLRIRNTIVGRQELSKGQVRIHGSYPSQDILRRILGSSVWTKLPRGHTFAGTSGAPRRPELEVLADHGADWSLTSIETVPRLLPPEEDSSRSVQYSIYEKLDAYRFTHALLWWIKVCRSRLSSSSEEENVFW